MPAKKLYIHASVQQDRHQSALQRIQCFSAKYFAVGLAGLAIAGNLIPFNATASMPLARMGADSFITSEGSMHRPKEKTSKGPVIEMQPGSTITNHITTDVPASVVTVRARTSSNCGDRGQAMDLYLNDELAGSITIDSEKYDTYPIPTGKPAGSYAVMLRNASTESCDGTVTIDQLKVFGEAVAGKARPTPSAGESAANQAPSPTPSAAMAADSVPAPSSDPDPKPVQPETAANSPVSVTCPNPAHTPGGSDGMGGCWPYENNTGVPSGVTLTSYSDQCTITSPAAIDAKTIDCDLVIKAPVIITRSVVNGRIDANYGHTLEISDSIVNAGATTSPAIGVSNLTVRRSEVTGGQQSIACASTCTIEDNWLHSQHNPDGGAARNAAYVSHGGSNHTIRHNSLLCSANNNTTGGGCLAGAAISGDFTGMASVTFDKNLFVATPSGGYCGMFGYNPGKPFGGSPAAIAVTNNVFQRGANGKCGASGPAASFTEANGNTWNNNRWDDSGGIAAPAN